MELAFDFIIFFYLITVGIFLLQESHHRVRLRNSKLRQTIFVLFILSWITIFYGSFIEPRLLIIKQTSVNLIEAPTQTIRAVVFSDIHAGPFKKSDWVSKVVKRVQEIQPDIIFILGDFVVKSATDIQYLSPLAELRAPYGVYAVTGNHEYYANASNEVIAALESFGIEVIENETLNLEIENKTLRIAGVSDIWFEGDIGKTMQSVVEEDTTIMLAHNPDVVFSDTTRLADLVLAAHTHGGQISLPFIGPVPAVPTRLGRAFDKGWFEYNGQPFFITSGVGETGTRARLFNIPEIVEMKIGF
ncbi:metallophosphoesterase [Candidatus Uhrbacteria bacterium]|nr:metallophosphoesterase [Candidatus Uhrbacteria bacterium]